MKTAGARAGQQSHSHRILHLAGRSHEAQSAIKGGYASLDEVRAHEALQPGRTSIRKVIESGWDKRLPQLSYDRIMLHFLSRDGDFSREKLAGHTRPKRAFTAPTTSSGP